MPIPNVDPEEIRKFNTIQEDWWNPEGQCAALHHINPLRLQFVQQHTSLQDKKILDVGCGGGIFAEALAQAGATVTGIDLSENALQIAKYHQVNLNIDYQQTSVEDFAKKYPEKF